jgi:hypothetical protein
LSAPLADSPRLVRCSVSGARPTLNQPPSTSSPKSVTVRQTPLTAMLSPIEQSARMGAASANVWVKPWPSAESCGVSDLSRARCSIYRVSAERVSACTASQMRSRTTYETGEHAGQDRGERDGRCRLALELPDHFGPRRRPAKDPSDSDPSLPDRLDASTPSATPSTLAMGMLARLFDLHRVSTSEADTLRRKVRRKERLAAAAKRHAATIASVPLPCVLLVRPCSRLTCSRCASPNAGRS